MCLLALMGALMFVMQVAMAPVRNVHMTDVLIILTAVFRASTRRPALRRLS